MRKSFGISLKVLVLIIVFFSILSINKTTNAIYMYSDDEYLDLLTPFWSTTTMYNESVLMVSDGKSQPNATLLFEPVKILSVRDSSLEITYKEGVDWVYEDNMLKLMPNSSAKYMITSELYPATPKKGEYQDKLGGGYVLFHEGPFFHERQLAVTYTFKDNSWKGPIPEFSENALPKTISKLKSGELLRIGVYGDSISAGCNSSKFINASPFMHSLDTLIYKNLINYYDSPINMRNHSVGGADSRFGLENAESKMNLETFDLVLIGFGMNDALSPAEFKNNIQGIMDKIRIKNPDTEFILISTMLPNAETYFMHGQPDYYPALRELEDPGVVVANITGVHQELLKHKKYLDMTGNNINHPNDFLIRWYAQYISGMLIDPSIQPKVTKQPVITPSPVTSDNKPASTPLPKSSFTNLLSSTWAKAILITLIIMVICSLLILYIYKKKG